MITLNCSGAFFPGETLSKLMGGLGWCEQEAPDVTDAPFGSLTPLPRRTNQGGRGPTPSLRISDA